MNGVSRHFLVLQTIPEVYGCLGSFKTCLDGSGVSFKLVFAILLADATLFRKTCDNFYFSMHRVSLVTENFYNYSFETDCQSRPWFWRRKADISHVLIKSIHGDRLKLFFAEFLTLTLLDGNYE